ncbi:family 10 glycosylhydrolase [Spirulina major CS-329]|uniref:family 10 glycosylhydrolase n=1 Tax=Spirulina TaxID=1154 RepID=UPI0023300B9D|nr:MULTISPECIES: family 10 glycosylhydrolase [Spirulina]MDB9494537.1 family 10 glycosylhydrolase [Spirulina subsalsa CS-330]MDB9502938.1 family 10 glycosylhydrolase [Spirulina major CS-329]
MLRSLLAPRASLHRILSALLLSSTLLAPCTGLAAAQAQTGNYCQFTDREINRKEALRRAAVGGNAQAQAQYQAVIQEHSTWLQQCRQRTWPRTQAIWLRLYPCDLEPGVLDAVFDRIVNKGYNEVYLEVFYDSQVLLPVSENRTPWVSVVRDRGQENADLLAMAVEESRDRNLKIYAWMFAMNYGYAYAVRPDRERNLARNGQGQTSLDVVPDGSQAFIDPYSPQGQADYATLLQAVLRRNPDGVLFDYIRYPRGSGGGSVASNVRDLWIYGDASRTALLNRAQNNQGRELIQRFMAQGSISGGDVQSAKALHPGETGPQWQGLSSSNLNAELWKLSVAHAAQGVIDFLNTAATQVQRQRIPAGAVFFPDGNRPVGQQGYDSRLQPWDRFSSQIEWHPMSYAICGNRTDCIVDEVQRVLSFASPQTRVIPALAGQWGRVERSHPPLEQQMWALQRQFPQLDAISHFAYSWQEPVDDRARQTCRR